MRVIGFRNCEVRVWDDLRSLQTHFPSGAYVPAAPRDDQAAFAAELGYADPWLMVHDHELLHSWLAEKMGYPYSPTLFYVAHGTPRPDVVDHEEAVVTSFQRYLNGCGDGQTIAFLREALGVWPVDLMAEARELLAPARLVAL